MTTPPATPPRRRDDPPTASALGSLAAAADAQEDSPARHAHTRQDARTARNERRLQNLDTVSGYSTLNNLIGRAFTRQPPRPVVLAEGSNESRGLYRLGDAVASPSDGREL